MIKVFSFTGGKIKTEFLKERFYKLAEPVQITINTSEGVYRWKLDAGFVTDMRSGAGIIDAVIPQFTGNNQYNLAILAHDAGYTQDADGNHYLSKDLADEFLYQMALMSGEPTFSGFWGKLKAKAMWAAVRTPLGNKAYYSPCEDVYKDQHKYMRLTIGAK